MSGMNGMNFHSSGMILNVSEWGERQFHDVINCSLLSDLPKMEIRKVVTSLGSSGEISHEN